MMANGTTHVQSLGFPTVLPLAIPGSSARQADSGVGQPPEIFADDGTSRIGDVVPVAGLARPVRIAATADLHVRRDRPYDISETLQRAAAGADLLLVAGDLTDNGRLEEFSLVAEVLSTLAVPVIVVLGNHDRRCLRRTAMRRTLRAADVTLLDGNSVVLALPGPGDQPIRLEVVGIGGYGGGFWPDEASDPLPLHRATQAFAVRARREAARLDQVLSASAADADARVVLMHYSPTSSTLGNEPIVKHWMLGNIELARVIDRHQVDLVIHGHAHLGNENGHTVGGTPVRNVAANVIGSPIVYELRDPGAQYDEAGQGEGWRRD